MLLKPSLAAFISFEFAYFANALILISSFKNYERLIKAGSKEYELKSYLLKPKKIKIKRFHEDIGVKKSAKLYLAYFSLYKLLAYIFLIFGILWLKQNGYLSIFPLLLGFFVLPLASLLQLLRKEKK